MRKPVFLTLSLLMMVTISGCGDQIHLENAAILLAVGLDVDDKEQMTLYTSNPVFSEEAKEKVNLSTAQSITLRKGRTIIDAMSTGTVVTGKLQSVLVTKRLLKQRNVFPYLDVNFRDAKNDINAKIIAVDGTLEDIFLAKMEDKGRIGVVLRNLVESTHRNGNTVLTTLQQYHRQTLDKRITPAFTEIKKGKNEIIVTGTTLLDKKGKYATSLALQESSILLLLQQKVKNPLPFTFEIPARQFGAKEELSKISIDVVNVKQKVKTAYKNDRFAFDVNMKISVVINERLFPLDQKKKGKTIGTNTCAANKKRMRRSDKKAAKTSHRSDRLRCVRTGSSIQAMETGRERLGKSPFQGESEHRFRGRDQQFRCKYVSM